MYFGTDFDPKKCEKNLIPTLSNNFQTVVLHNELFICLSAFQYFADSRRVSFKRRANRISNEVLRFVDLILIHIVCKCNKQS